MSDGGSTFDGAGSENAREDLVVCTLKLLAVRDKDYKLIGLVNFEVDWQKDNNEVTLLFDQKVLSFQKCIDPAASITVSAKLVDVPPLIDPQNMTDADSCRDKAVSATRPSLAPALPVPDATTQVSIVKKR